MARYDRELRLRVAGDPAIARLFVAEGRKYVDAVLADMQVLGRTVGARTLRNAAGVEFRVLVAGSVPILEIDVENVAVEEIAAAAFMVWPATEVAQDAHGETPQVLLLPPRSENGPWRPQFFDAASRPDASLGGLYGSVFADGFTRLGNVDWTNSSGAWSVSWYGPRSRYFIGRRAGTWMEDGGGVERTFGEYQFHAEVFYKGKLLLDVETVSLALTGEADVYVRGACVRVINGTAYLFVVASKFGGENTQGFDYEIDIRDFVLRFTMQSASPSAPTNAIVANSGVLIGERIGLYEYESDHPWMFNGDGTGARTIRYLTDEAFDAFYVREVEVTIDEPGDEATFSEVETAEVPERVESASHTSNNSLSTFAAKLDAVVPGDGPGTPPAVRTFTHPFDTSTKTDANGLDVSWWLDKSTGDFIAFASAPQAGTISSTTVTTGAQERHKVAVDWKDGQWVYAYSLGVHEVETRTHSQTRTVDECYYSEIVNFVVGSYDEVTGNWSATADGSHGRSHGSVSGSYTASTTGRSGGLEFGSHSYESTIDATSSMTFSGTWSNDFTRSEYTTVSGDGVSLTEPLGDVTSAAASAEMLTTIESAVCVLWLDLRSESAILLERATTVTTTSSVDYSYSGTVVGHVYAVSNPDHADFTIPKVYSTTSQTDYTYRVIVNGKVVKTLAIPGSANATSGSVSLTPKTRANVQSAFSLPYPYLPGSQFTDVIPAELRSFAPGTSAGFPESVFYGVTKPSDRAAGDDLEWRYLFVPYFDLYERWIVGVWPSSAALTPDRVDNDGVVHYGAMTVSPKRQSHVFSFVAVDQNGESQFVNGLSNDELGALTGFPDSDGFLPNAYLPPTTGLG